MLRGIGAEDNARIRIHFKRAAIRDLEDRKTIRSGDDHLPHLYLAADLQSPGSGIFQNGNLAGEMRTLAAASDEKMDGRL